LGNSAIILIFAGILLSKNDFARPISLYKKKFDIKLECELSMIK
jgi:hypothetical protein